MVALYSQNFLFLFLFFLSSAVAAAGPLVAARRALVEVLSVGAGAVDIVVVFRLLRIRCCRVSRFCIRVNKGIVGLVSRIWATQLSLCSRGGGFPFMLAYRFFIHARLPVVFFHACMAVCFPFMLAWLLFSFMPAWRWLPLSWFGSGVGVLNSLGVIVSFSVVVSLSVV
jgi:hypothetical protein